MRGRSGVLAFDRRAVSLNYVEYLKTIAGAACALAFFTACGGSDSPAGASVDWTNGRGSATCHEWQRAYCELANKCGGTALADCAKQYQGIACNSDTTAANCATTLAASSCATVPTGCSATDLADTAPAIAGCTQLYTSICAINTRCGATTTADACMTELQTQHNCNSTIGLELSFETCISKLGSESCDSTSAPAECSKVMVNAP